MRRYLFQGSVIILVAIVLHLLLIHPFDTAEFRGEQVELYSISALVISFLLKCVVVFGLYFYLRAASLKWPNIVGKGKLGYKSLIAFLFLLIFLNLTELALKGIFTQEVLKERIEEYEHPDVKMP